MAETPQTPQTRSAIAPEYTTPYKRARRKGSVATSVKKAVLLVISTDEPECLVTRTRHPTEALQVAHVLDRATKASVVSALERAWGVRRLHLDSRFNLFHLDAILHNLYDRFLWTIVPNKELLRKIQKYYEALKTVQENSDLVLSPSDYRKTYPVGNKITHDYHFVPLPPMCRLSDAKVLRSYSSTPDQMSTQFPTVDPPQSYPVADQGCLYKNPFTTFPVLHSHIHPFFVICKAYYAFRSHVSKNALPTHLHEHWGLLSSIYRLWVPDEPKLDTFLHDDDHLDDAAGEFPDDASTANGDEGREPNIEEEDEEDTHQHRDPEIQGPSDRLPDLGYCSDCSSEEEMEIIHPLDISLWAEQCIWAWDDEDGNDKAKVEAAWKREVNENMRTLDAEQFHASA